MHTGMCAQSSIDSCPYIRILCVTTASLYSVLCSQQHSPQALMQLTFKGHVFPTNVSPLFLANKRQAGCLRWTTGTPKSMMISTIQAVLCPFFRHFLTFAQYIILAQIICPTNEV